MAKQKKGDGDLDALLRGEQDVDDRVTAAHHAKGCTSQSRCPWSEWKNHDLRRMSTSPCQVCVQNAVPWYARNR
jgi:hypothetical protein